MRNEIYEIGAEPENRGSGSGSHEEYTTALGNFTVYHWGLSKGDFTEIVPYAPGMPRLHLKGHVSPKEMASFYFTKLLEIAGPLGLAEAFTGVKSEAYLRGQADAQKAMRQSLGL